jgi:hypothetical protein
MPDMHEIDDKVFAEGLQYVEVELDPNEATVAQASGTLRSTHSTARHAARVNPPRPLRAGVS